MKCQKCRKKEAITFATELRDGKLRSLVICGDCFLPLRAFPRIDPEAKNALVLAGREMTDLLSACRVRLALLFFLLETGASALGEALAATGFDLSRLREEIASHLGEETSGEGDSISARGLTPVLIEARKVAQRMEDDTIRVEHLFLALIESPALGDPEVVIRLAGQAGQIEKNLMAGTALLPQV